MTEESYEFCLSKDYYSASQASSDHFSGLAKPDGGIMTSFLGVLIIDYYWYDGY